VGLAPPENPDGMNKLLILFSAILLLASCRSTRKIQTAISKKDTATLALERNREDSLRFIRNTLAQLDSNRIQFTTFNSKVNIDYKGGDGKKYDVNGNIRMYRDSAIWISANAILGIEAMRVLITKDSVKVLDKINKVYTARSMDYLQDITALPLDLPTLQQLIIGNPVFLDTTVASLTSTSSTISMLTIGMWFKNLLTINSNNKTIEHSKLDDVNIARNRTADLSYSDYENKKGPQFATKRRIVVTENKILDIKLDFKQYDFNQEVSFPFSVPRNYDRN
jgi:outer membrane biogenesis lipoprotein LolB